MNTPICCSGRGLALLFLFLLPALSFAQDPTDRPRPEIGPVFKVHDRFGDEYTLDDIAIPHNSIVAGMFRLHIEDQDNNTNDGFDDPNLGAARTAVLVQVYEDLSALLGGFTQNPYPGLTYPCSGASAPFPDCRVIEVWVRESENSATAGWAGRATSFYKHTNLPEINSGVVWQYVNTGFDPWHLLPYQTAGSPNGGTPLSGNYGAYSYYHCWTQMNWYYNYNNDLSAAPSGSQIDLYHVILHEALHTLGIYSMIDANGESKISGTNPGIYTHWDLFLENSSGGLMTFDLDNSQCWLATYTGGNLAITAACPSVDFVDASNGINHGVYTATTFSGGSSLSHFNCGSPAGWVMNAGGGGGYVQRYPRPEEYRALCAIGYELSGTYGAGGSGVVLHPTSMTGVTHNSNTVSYSLGSCPSTHRIAATDDFGPYDPSAYHNGGGQNWNTSNFWQTPIGTLIQIPTSEVIANDYNAVGINCVPEVIHGGGNCYLTNGGNTINYTPDPAFFGTAVLRYRSRNSAFERSNTGYIFISVMPPACTFQSLCEENLACLGDFEDIYPCHFHNSPLNAYGRFGPTVLTTQTNNSPDLLPSSCNVPQYCLPLPPPPNTPGCYPHGEMHCQGGGTINMPGPNIFSSPNTQYAMLAGNPDNTEQLTFKLKKPLDDGCIRVEFSVASGCYNDVNFVFSATEPCNHQMAYPMVSSPCQGGGTYVPMHQETFNISPQMSGNTPVWQAISQTFNLNLTGAEYVTVYLTPAYTVGTYGKSAFIDDVTIIDCDDNNVTITPTVTNPNPCIGDVFQIQYEICNSGSVSIPPGLLVEADASTSLGVLQFMGTGSFNLTGQGYTTQQLNPNDCETLVLNVQLTNSAVLNQSYCVDLIIPNGPCIVGSAVTDCVTAGTPTLSIDKFLETPGPYSSGDIVEFNIQVTNFTQNTFVQNIIVEDILPPGFTFISASGNWNQNGTTNITDPFGLAAGDAITFGITVEIDNTVGCGSLTNCASVTQAQPFCGPVTDCEILNITPSGAQLIGAVATSTSCFGGCDGSISMSPTGSNYYYTLMNPPGCYGPPISTNNPILSPVSAGTYTIQLFDLTTGCTQSTQITVTEPSPVLATSTPVSPSCPGVCDGQIQLTPTGGVPPYTYTYGGNIPTGNPVMGLCGNAGYLVTVTDNNGCFGTTFATIWDPPSINVLFSSTMASCATTCDATTTGILSGGTGLLTWQYFAPGSSTASLSGMGSPAVMTGLCVGSNHLLKVTDGNGCVQDYYFNTVGPAGVNISLLTTDETCLGDDDGTVLASVSGGTAPYTYVWSGPNGFSANTMAISGLAPGTYCLTVIDQGNCPIPDVCAVVGPGLDISASVSVIDPISCNGVCDGQLQINPSGGGPNYIITVDPPNGTPYSPSGTTIQNLCAGNYLFTVTDQNSGCSTTLNYNLTQPSVLGVSSSSVTLPSCWGSGCDGQVTIAGNGGTPPYSYSFTSGGPWSGSGYFSTLCQATVYQLWVKDNNGCTQFVNVNVGTPTQPVYNTQIGEACGTGCTGSITTTASLGTPPYTFTLNGGSTQVQNSTASWTGLCPGNYTVSHIDAQGCTFGVSYTVASVPADPWPKNPNHTTLTDRARALDMANDEANDEYYMTGFFRGTITFDDIFGNQITLNATGGSNDLECYLAKYNSCGVVWAHNWGSTGRDISNMVRYNAANDKLYVGGEIFGTWNGFLNPSSGVSMLPPNATNNGGSLSLSTNLGRKGFVIQVDPDNGEPDWVWIAGSLPSNQSIVREVEMTSYGPAVGLDFRNTLSVLGNNLVSNGGWDIALVTLDFNGIPQVWDNFGSTANDGCRGLDHYIGGDAPLITDHIAMTGFIGGPTGTWDGVPYTFYTGANGRDVFLSTTKVEQGVPAQPFIIEVFGGAGEDRGLDIVTTGDDQTSTPGLFVTGDFEQSLGITSSPPTSNAGSRDAFVSAHLWNLSAAWARGSGGAEDNDAGRSITIAPNGNVYAGGFAAGNSITGFLSNVAPTGGPVEEEPWVVGFAQANGLSTNVYPNTTNNGNGNQNRVYDLECTSNYIYTAGSIGSVIVQWPQTVPRIYSFSGALVFSNTNYYEAYMARMDYLGTYQPKLGVAGAQALEQEYDLSVFPNPTSGEFTVSWTLPDAVSLEVMDLKGRLIRQLDVPDETQQLNLNMREQAQGVYLVRLITDHGVETLRLVKE